MSLDNRVFENIPSLAAASIVQPQTQQNNFQLNQIALAVEKNKQLSSMDDKTAQREFGKLDPSLQKTLSGLYNNPKYSQTAIDPNANLPWWKKAVKWGMSSAASPFKYFFDAANFYYHGINSVYNMLGMEIKGNISADQFFDSKAWKAAWNGNTLYDNNSWNKLLNHYGKEKSFVAAKILAGKSMGEIIEDWGNMTPAMMDTISQAMDPKSEFNDILNDFKAAQLSPGRELARAIFDLPIGHSKNDWLFDKFSGTADAFYQIAADPLTYASGGLVDLAKGTRLAMLASKYGKTGDISILSKLFDTRNVTKSWDEIGSRIKKLSELQADKTDESLAKAASVRESIKKDFPGLASDEKIKILQEAEVHDAESAKVFFTEDLRGFNDIIAGRLQNSVFHKVGLPIARSNRVLREGFSDDVAERLFSKGTNIGEVPEKINSAMNNYYEASKNGKFVSPQEIDHSNWLDKLSRHFSLHPGNNPIYVDGPNVVHSIDTVYRYARLLTTKPAAKVLAEMFLHSDTSRRLIIIRGLYTGIAEKIGLPHVVGGAEKLEQILNDTFGNTGTMGIESTMRIPGQLVDALGIPDIMKSVNISDAAKTRIMGAVHGFQFSNMIAPFKFDDVISSTANAAITGKGKVANAARNLGKLRMISGLTENSVVRNMNNVWSRFTLFPRLGIRSAIDEAIMHSLVAPTKALALWLRRDPQRMRNVFAAALGTNDYYGPLSTVARSFFKRNPGTAIDKKMREAIYLEAEELSAKSGYKVSPLYIYHSMLFEEAWNMYGKHLPEKYHDILFDVWRHNPHFIEGIKSNVIQTVAGKSILSDKYLSDALARATELQKTIEDAGIKINKNGKYVEIDTSGLSDSNLALAHQHELTLRFVNNHLVIEGGKDEAPIVLTIGDIFLHNNGLKTADDVEKASRAAYSAVGLSRTKGVYGVCNRSRLVNFLSNFGSNGLYLNAGALANMGLAGSTVLAGLDALPDHALIQLAQTHVMNMFVDTYHAFHGSSDNFNEKLLKYITDAKIGKTSFSDIVQNIPPDDFNNLTKGMRISGKLNTALNFDGSKPESLMQRFGNEMWNAMDRQVTGFVRAPAMTLYTVMERMANKPAEEQYVEKLIEAGYSRPSAEAFASKSFTELAVRNATSEVLKWSDNPAMRTNLAFALKTNGRFIRASEDFYRRMYRMATQKNLTSIYRMRLAMQGLQSSGFMYKDQNGEQYIAVPGDNIIFSAVHHTLDAMYGKNDLMVQPQFSDFSFRFSSLNPSFSQQSGVPTFSGPFAGLSVLAVQSLLKSTGYTGEIISDKLDNLALGDVGDNLTMWKAIVPQTFARIWKMGNRDETMLNAGSAYRQAISYMAANGQLVGKDGKKLTNTSSPEDRMFFINRLKIAVKNVLVMREALNLTLPVSLTMSDSVDVPSYIKKNGFITPRSEFMDIVKHIRNKYQDEVQDPYELAMVMWMHKNPGRAIYSLPQNDKQHKVRLDYVAPLKSWMLANKDNIDYYGDAALIFAPRVGEFSQASYNFLESNGYISEPKIDDYLQRIVNVNDYQRYFDLEKEMNYRLSKVADVEMRKAIITEYQNERKILLYSNPFLKTWLTDPKQRTAYAERLDIYNKLKSAVVDGASFVSNDQKSAFAKAIKLVDSTLATLQDKQLDSLNSIDSQTVQDQAKQKALQELIQMSANNPAIQEATRVVFRPLINQARPNKARAIGMR